MSVPTLNLTLPTPSSSSSSEAAATRTTPTPLGADTITITPAASTSSASTTPGKGTPLPISPLKQLNAQQDAPPIRPKLESCWEQLTTNPTLFAERSIPQLHRYFNELFCLTPNPDTIEQALDALSVQDLLGEYKDNITYLFTHATRTLRETQTDHITRSNITETLIPFLRNLLSRRYHNFSYETINLLAGSLAHSDTVFTNLVSAIDHTLQDRSLATPLRHRTLQLALVLVASIDQGSINAYFLRRDLFSTLVQFMTDDATCQFSFESALLLGLLANYRQHEARNPYRVRIEDMVEETVMARLIEVVQVVCQQARDSYTHIVDDAPASFVASITSLIFSFKVPEFFKQGLVFSLPPPPPLNRATSKASLRSESSTTPAAKPKADGRASVEAEVESKPTDVATKDSQTTPAATPDLVVSSAPSTAIPKEKKEENQFKAMPNEVLVILLPFFDLIHLNKSFCAFVLADSPSGKPSALPSTLISLCSYVLCHASVSSRARSYARLCLLLMMVLVEEGEGKLSKATDEIWICRQVSLDDADRARCLSLTVIQGTLQRIPMLPRSTGKRPALAAMLDCCVIFLRHNLRKKLDVETFIVCLRLIQRILQQLKTERIRLVYDWVTVWRSILSLAGFVVSQIEILRLVSTQIDDLISQIFILLSYAAYWGETLFPTSEGSALLFYELLHADETLKALSDLLGISSIPLPPSSFSASSEDAGSRRSSSSVFANPRTLAAIQATPLMKPSPLMLDPTTFFGGYATGDSGSGSGSGLKPPGPSSNASTTASGTSGSSSTASSAEPTEASQSHLAKGFIATECVSNLHLARTHFINSIEAFKQGPLSPLGKGEDPTLDPETIVAVIEDNLGGLELIESSAMGDMRKGIANMGGVVRTIPSVGAMAKGTGTTGVGANGEEAELSGAPGWERSMMVVVCKDVLSILCP
ncbi:BZ3500_MvSof-1268-A1-R1_Chr7-1g09200 [Microbotryum saponariae]|uniref:BZ3500_MvSof-1268-A1-R1_Chr7-1g09200 protein n=1 Tax=Microbotryum saponariae TaxID=289078 RepID=A0A2X0ND53_9BASI|nr:BZ3501_MvSof-1269-A2-R1_Chr7-1g08905 [Microbotryum saponariae]SDA02987.1 BZ3500_MvSof-1268-A1-R1_Chr7-1g09200 [Microbotryum saponariae]